MAVLWTSLYNSADWAYTDIVMQTLAEGDTGARAGFSVVAMDSKGATSSPAMCNYNVNAIDLSDGGKCEVIANNDTYTGAKMSDQSNNPTIVIKKGTTLPVTLTFHASVYGGKPNYYFDGQTSLSNDGNNYGNGQEYSVTKAFSASDSFVHIPVVDSNNNTGDILCPNVSIDTGEPIVNVCKKPSQGDMCNSGDLNLPFDGTGETRATGYSVCPAENPPVCSFQCKPTFKLNAAGTSCVRSTTIEI